MEQKRTLMMSIARTRGVWQEHKKSIALSLGIPESYRAVIMYLAKHPGANQRMIAEFSDVTASAINQTAKSMIAEGYVSKETDGSDRRHTKLFLTKKGEETARKLQKKMDWSDDRITELITPEKEAELIQWMDRIHDFIREEL